MALPERLLIGFENIKRPLIDEVGYVDGLQGISFTFSILNIRNNDYIPWLEEQHLSGNCLGNYGAFNFYLIPFGFGGGGICSFIFITL